MTDTLQLRPDERTGEQALVSIVYSSTATTPFSEADLARLLAVSRTNNRDRGLTGVLLHNQGQFMQALEGPERAVRRALRTIEADPRHRHVWVLDEAPITERRFGTWSMGYRALTEGDVEAAPAWFGSLDALDHRDHARASELLRWFRDR